jgi:ankyrin repeat protein
MTAWFVAAGKRATTLANALAASKADVKTLQRLLDEQKGKLNVNACDEQDKDGWTALGYAVRYGHSAVVALLLDRGADVEKSNRRGTRPLWVAALRGDADVVRALIAAGADLNVQALHVAARYNNLEIVRVLLAAGADVHAKNDAGKTAAEVAAEKGHAKLVSLLSELALQGQL